MKKQALVTGATSGIGRATALRLAAEGYDIIATGRRSERLESLRREIEAAGGRCTTLTFDVRSEEAVRRNLEPLGRVDLLVNNAGLAAGLEHIDKGDTADWDAMIDTNVKGLLYVTRVITPKMVAAGGGHVFNIGSIAGTEPYENGAVYCASKHAVHAISQAMPADTLLAIRQLPSLSEVFAHMLKEMKKEASSTLIIDLRNNSGGWTPIVLPTLYQLFGDHFLQTDMDIEFYRIISPLYMQKLQTNLQDFNQAYGTDYAYGDYTFSTDEADTTNIEQRRTDFIKNCISSVPEELRKQQGKALYTPEHIYVIINERTFSAAFHYTFYLWKMGATLVGIPSGQAPNTYMEQTLFRLPYTGMQGSISNSIQICFPGKDRCAHTLYPDLMPTYQDYQRYNFDVQTEILYLLDKIKSAPHSHTNPAEKNQK